LNADVPTLSVATSNSPSVYGNAVTLTATISSGPAGTVTFYDGANSIGTGTISGTTATLVTKSLISGSHTITAAWLGNSSYAAVTSAAVLQVVNKATPAIAWANPAAIVTGTPLSAAQLDATSPVLGTFSYSPPAGTVLTAGAYTLSATFTPTDTNDYTTATTSVSITVGQPSAPPITWVTPAAITYGTALSAAQLDASSTIAGTFSYSPAAGTVLKAGTQALSVTFTPNSAAYTTATATVQLTVNQATPVITWPAPTAITYGTALSAAQLNASSKVAGTFAYSPVAGAVPNAGTQTLSVTFTPTDTADYTTATSSVSITVNQATPVITWPAPAAITYGTALSAAQLDASSTVAGSFVYSPPAGTVPNAGTQTLSVTFTPNSANYKTATTTVQLTVGQPSAPPITWATPAAITYGTALSAAQLDASSTIAGTFSYSPSAGTVLKAGTQTLSVTFTPNSAGYTTSTATVQLTVNQATPAITWPAPTAITYGTALSAAQLNASSTVAGTFAYSPAVGTVPNAGTQTLSVTFTPTDSTDYATATGSVSITVNQATPVITWPAPAAITYGTALSAAQLDATTTAAGTFSYSPAAGTVTKAGTQTLSVTFTPTSASYKATSATVQLTVNQAKPAITWATPAAITVGTALSAAQLDASSTVAGTFAYSPAAGMVPNTGTQTLSVTLTPTDTTDYSTATQTVTLTVNAATSTLSVGAVSVAFGNVTVGTPATQTVNLTSAGTAAVTISTIAVTGSGLTFSGPALPASLTPGQTAQLNIQFDPSAVGAMTGQLTITSNSSTGATATVNLTGTGVAAAYAVDLTWDAPTSSADPVVGYNIYRAPSGSSSYQLLNSTVDSQTAYADSTVQNGASYNYIVESVDASGVESVPTGPVAVTIP